MKRWTGLGCSVAGKNRVRDHVGVKIGIRLYIMVWRMVAAKGWLL
jgi:hypothetical protein